MKDVRTKSRKIDPLPLVRKMCALAQPPLPYPCGHTINSEKFEVFLHQKVRTLASEEPSSPLVRKMFALYNPPDCGRPLWTPLAKHNVI